MDLFWQWMKDKYDLFPGSIVHDLSGGVYVFTNQMEIGYMMEYLRESTGKIILDIGGSASMNQVYNSYVAVIEKQDKK